MDNKADRVYFLVKEIYYYEHKYNPLTEEEKKLRDEYRAELKSIKEKECYGKH